MVVTQVKRYNGSTWVDYNIQVSADNLFFSFKRQGAFPLDACSVFYSIEAAQDYAVNNPIAYAGQTIVVVTNNTASFYIIKDTSGNLIRLMDEGDVEALKWERFQ